MFDLKNARKQLSTKQMPPIVQLRPTNSSFEEKSLDLFSNIVIGRQSNAVQVPSKMNGFFSSKVLSRKHAEIFFKDGVFIKDLGSANGTFVNGKRLSEEGEVSEIWN